MNWRSYIPSGPKPGALTAGLCIFMFILYALNWILPINDAIVLEVDALKGIKLNRLTLYPLAHMSFLHLFFNCISIFGPLSLFEASHGTVFTGVMLNLLALFTAIIYCLVGMLLFPNSRVGGASGWCFTLFGYYAVKESRFRPHYQITANYKFPTLYSPVVVLMVVFVLFPGSSFWGHFIGLGLGYLLGFKENWFAVLVPPTSIISKIEHWLDRWIGMIPPIVTYYREASVDRSMEYTSIYQDDQLPLYNNDNYRGQGRVLGS
ncbi:HER144Wp [Eremothecium sinecaudum]|uniref:Rhomboid-type serine protease 2 n=1 Tax=Eremothecium sinecaudum TaxID=45286 RepID=A0A109V066_9SACH|nr:HER144Wp [Eremothecium sinecaudum]AMD21423.1 HER144Wp [Eremothecium sinecaudum]